MMMCMKHYALELCILIRIMIVRAKIYFSFTSRFTIFYKNTIVFGKGEVGTLCRLL